MAGTRLVAVLDWTNLASAVVTRLPDPTTLDGLRSQFVWGAILAFAEVFAVVLAILVIRQIQSRADERADVLASAAVGHPHYERVGGRPMRAICHTFTSDP
jgi:hypothetical protein